MNGVRVTVSLPPQLPLQHWIRTAELTGGLVDIRSLCQPSKDQLTNSIQ